MSAVVRHHTASLATEAKVPTIAQCRVCVSPLRHRAENELLDGVPPIEVVRRLPIEAGISVQSVRRHVARHHLPVDRDKVAEYLDQRSHELATVLAEKATEVARREIDQALLTLAAGKLRLDNGEIVITASHIVRAMRIMAEREQGDTRVRIERMRSDQLDYERITAVERLFDLVEQTVGPSATGRIIRAAVNDRATSDIMLTTRLRALLEHPEYPT